MKFAYEIYLALLRPVCDPLMSCALSAFMVVMAVFDSVFNKATGLLLSDRFCVIVYSDDPDQTDRS